MLDGLMSGGASSSAATALRQSCKITRFYYGKHGVPQFRWHVFPPERDWLPPDKWKLVRRCQVRCVTIWYICEDVNSYVHFGKGTDVANELEPTEIESDDDVQFISIMDLPLLY